MLCAGAGPVLICASMSRLIAGLCRPRVNNAAAPAFFLMLLAAVPVRADYIHLKNGRIADGKFVTVEGADYVFRSGNQELRAAIKDTKKMVVGYRGVPVCLRRHGWPRDCSALLFVLDSREALVGYPEQRRKKAEKKAEASRGWLRSARVPLDRIAFMEFKSSDDGRLPLIRPGVRIRPGGADKPGTVVKAGRKEIRYRPTGGDEQLFKVGERVATIRLLPPRVISPRKTQSPPRIAAWNYFVPGMAQWRRGEKLSAGVFLGAVVGFTGLAYQEVRHASNMAGKINRNPVELYFSSLAGGDRAAYTGHVNRYRGLLGAQLIAYALAWIHALEWWPFRAAGPGIEEPGVGRLNGARFAVPRPVFFLKPAESRMTADSGLRLNWKWRF